MDFMERMEAGRDAAAYRRHRGLTTGKSAAGWDTVQREIEAGTWEHHFESAKAAVRCAIGIAQDEYLRAVYPERYFDDVTLDDVIADRHAADTAAILETF